jgi:hypothetical protein
MSWSNDNECDSAYKLLEERKEALLNQLHSFAMLGKWLSSLMIGTLDQKDFDESINEIYWKIRLVEDQQRFITEREQELESELEIELEASHENPVSSSHTMNAVAAEEDNATPAIPASLPRPIITGKDNVITISDDDDSMAPKRKASHLDSPDTRKFKQTTINFSSPRDGQKGSPLSKRTGFPTPASPLTKGVSKTIELNGSKYCALGCGSPFSRAHKCSVCPTCALLHDEERPCPRSLNFKAGAEKKPR